MDGVEEGKDACLGLCALPDEAEKDGYGESTASVARACLANEGSEADKPRHADTRPIPVDTIGADADGAQPHTEVCVSDAAQSKTSDSAELRG